jgi:predicted NodU family carbamoyl transferase
MDHTTSRGQALAAVVAVGPLLLALQEERVDFTKAKAKFPSLKTRKISNSFFLSFSEEQVGER